MPPPAGAPRRRPQRATKPPSTASEHNHTTAWAPSSRPEPSDRFEVAHLRLRPGIAPGEAVDHLGVDDAGADRVHPQADLRVVERRVPREPHDAMLRRHVGGDAGEADQARHRRAVDDW